MSESVLSLTVRLWNPGLDDWLLVRDQVVDLEVEAFGMGAFPVEYLEFEFSQLENSVVVMFSPDQLVGFTIAAPVTEVMPERRDRDTAYSIDTVIRAAWRGRGIVRVLMAALEAELRKRGYRYLERDAAVANGYAGAISRAYSSRILTQSEPHPSPWGPQVFFRVSLDVTAPDG